MTDKENTIVVTDEDEIAILMAASCADNQARKRANPRDAIYFYNDEERVIMDRKRALEEKYRKEMNSAVPPLLLFDPLIHYDQDEVSVLKSTADEDADAKETDATLSSEVVPIVPIQFDAQPITVSLQPMAPVSVAMPATYTCNGSGFTGQIIRQFGNMPPSQFIDQPKRITNAALEDSLLNKVQLRRIQETVYIFNGIYYHKMTTNELESLIHQHLRESLGIKAEAHQINEIKKLITTDNRFTYAKQEVPFGLVNLSNGVYDIFRDTLVLHSHDWFFTSALTVPWVPESECPVFDAFLSSVTHNNAALIQRFWEAIGYALVPDNRGKRFLYLYGESQTGKTVLCELLASFFPDDVVSSVSVFDLDSSFGYSGLVEKEINICSELSGGILGEDAVGKIKAITGGDTVEVNEKYKALYKTKLNVKLIFASNHAIRLSGNDDALAQRCLVLPFQFPVPVEARDRFLVQKLLNERPGILRKALLAYRKLVSRNYVFTLDNCIQPPVFAKRSNIEINGLESFLKNYCAFNPQEQVATSTLFTRYHQYCESAGWRRYQTERDFGAQLSTVIKEIYPQTEKTKVRFSGFNSPVNGYRGLSLLPEADTITP